MTRESHVHRQQHGFIQRRLQAVGLRQAGRDQAEPDIFFRDTPENLGGRTFDRPCEAQSDTGSQIGSGVCEWAPINAGSSEWKEKWEKPGATVVEPAGETKGKPLLHHEDWKSEAYLDGTGCVMARLVSHL